MCSNDWAARVPVLQNHAGEHHRSSRTRIGCQRPNLAGRCLGYQKNATNRASTRYTHVLKKRPAEALNLSHRHDSKVSVPGSHAVRALRGYGKTQVEKI